MSTKYGENNDLIVILKDNHGNPINDVQVSVDLNGVENYTTDNEGQINVSTSKLAPGTYIAKIHFGEDDYCFGCDMETIVEVKKSATQIIASSVETTYNSGAFFLVSLKDSNGNPIQNILVSVDLGGVKSYTTNEKGQIKIPIQKLVPKTYVAKIKFNGNSYYVGSKDDSVVVVKKATPKMSAKSKAFKIKTKTKKYSIILKNNKKQVIKKAKVYLKVKGKTYVAKTNSKGKATFKIFKLTKKGKYTAVITYKGNKYYNKLTEKVKITVK